MAAQVEEHVRCLLSTQSTVVILLCGLFVTLVKTLSRSLWCNKVWSICTFVKKS